MKKVKQRDTDEKGKTPDKKTLEALKKLKEQKILTNQTVNKQ